MSTPTGPRRLLLMRHAKAAAHGTDDHGRDLTDRGRRDAAAAGAWLAAQGLVPTHALVSTAARTTQTWQAVAASTGSTARAAFTEELYAAGPDAALDVITGADPDARVLLVVGHNPTVAYLAQLLSDGLPEPEALRGMSVGYPPAALTVLDVEGDWSGLAAGGGHVTGFHVGDDGEPDAAQQS